jgi:hypothetical protein
LLHCLPSASGHGQRVHRRGDTFSIDSEQLFEIRNLSSEARTLAERLNDMRFLNRSLVSAEKRSERVLLGEFVGKELSKIATVQASELIELKAGDSAVA